MLNKILWVIAVPLAACVVDASDAPNDVTRAIGPDAELACTADDVAWTSPAARDESCAGPWEYHLNYKCNYSGPDCQAKPESERTCTQWPQCTSWSHPPIAQSSGWRTAHLSFMHASGSGSASTKANSQCLAKAHAYYNGLSGTRRHPAYSKTVQLLSSEPVDTIYVRGKPRHVYRMDYRCKYKVDYERPGTARSSACGACESWQCNGYHDSCPRPCHGWSCWGMSYPAHYTPNGLSRDELDSWMAATGNDAKLRGQPICYSCDDIPLAQGEDKMACLQSHYAAAKAYAVGGYWLIANPAMRPRAALLARFIKIVAELRGDAMTDEQRDKVRALYHDEFLDELEAGGAPAESPVPACGVNREVAETCDGAAAVTPELEGTLDYCTRLTSGHVVKAMRIGEYDDVCAAAYDDLAAQLDAAACELPAHADEAKATVDRYAARGRAALRSELDAIEAAPMSSSARDAASVGAIGSFFAQITAWQRMMGALAEPAELAARVAEQNAAYWRAVQQPAYMASTYTESADAILEAATEDGAISGLRLDQLTLRAAYDDVEPPPLAGAALVAVTGDALASLVDRLDTLGELADVGCSLRDCHGRAEITPLAWLWNLVAHVSEPSEVASLAADSPTGLAGWRATFADIAPRLDRLVTALAPLTPEGAPAAPEAMLLVELIERATARAASYAERGTFGLPSGDELRSPLHSGARDHILSLVGNLTDQLDAKLAAFDDDVRDAVQAIVDREGAEANAAIIATRRDAKQIEAEELATRLQAHLDALAEAPTAGLEQAIDLAVSVTGTTPVLELTSLRSDLQLSAQDAHFADGDITNVSLLAAAPATTIDAGRVLAISSQGAYAPSCAVRQVSIVDETDATDVLGNRVDMTQVLTGPEGYTMSTVAQAFDGYTNTESGTHRVTAGVNVEACGGFNPTSWFAAASPFSFSVKVCAHTGYDYTRSWGWSDTDGTNSQTTIGFSSGLFLPNTPLPFAPAGALVAVEMPRGVTDPAQVRDFHLVRAPLTTIPITDDADVYLIVNDRYCAPQDGLNRLTVKLQQLASADDLGQAFLTSVGAAVDEIDAWEPAILAQGELSSAVASQLRADARAAALAAMDPPIPVSDFPPALREVYERFESAALAHLSHRVSASNLERELSLLDLALRSIDTELEHANRRSYLLDSLPRWSLRALRSDHIRRRGLTLGHAIRDYVRPVIELWDPALAAALRDDTNALALSRISVDTRTVDAVNQVELVSEALADGIVGMSLGWRENGQPVVTRPVIVDIPNTALAPTGCGFFGDCPTPPFTRVSDSLSLELWNALRDQLGLPLLDASGAPAPSAQAQSFTIQLSPDELYRISGGTGVLECSDELPVVRHIGLGFRSGDPQAIDQNGLGRWVTINLGSDQPFVVAGGERSFRVEDAGMLRVTDVPVFFAEPEQIEGEFYKKISPPAGGPAAARVIGLSPLASLTIELPGEAASWGIADAESLYLVLDVERVPTYDAAFVGGAPLTCPIAD